jgi:hypothetical protein
VNCRWSSPPSLIRTSTSAKTPGVTIPESFVARAAKVIE